MKLKFNINDLEWTKVVKLTAKTYMHGAVPGMKNRKGTLREKVFCVANRRPSNDAGVRTHQRRKSCKSRPRVPFKRGLEVFVHSSVPPMAREVPKNLPLVIAHPPIFYEWDYSRWFSCRISAVIMEWMTLIEIAIGKFYTSLRKVSRGLLPLPPELINGLVFLSYGRGQT